jgi:aldehyde:ferredoxin oxidoreductase
MVEYGGAGYVKWADDEGLLAAYNFRRHHFNAADQIDGKNLADNIKRSRGCYKCPVRCKAELAFKKGRLKNSGAVRPEFEPMLALGSKCGLDDLETLVYLDNLCSRMGIDSISAGSTIAFAMDLFDRGILSLENTGNTDLSWGNGQAMEALIRQMAHAEGFGALLSKGVVNAAKAIGRGAENYAPHVKGLELPGYHPNRVMGTALGYAVTSRGADFNDVYASLQHNWSKEEAAETFGSPRVVDPTSIEGKAQMVKRARIAGIVLDCLGICKVPALSLICKFDLIGEAELFTAVCGRPITPEGLFTVGERILNLEQLFNIRHGATGADDRLPDMFFTAEYSSREKPPGPEIWIEPMIQEFYKIMGWDDQGKPTDKKLSELGLAAIRSTSRSAD